VICTSQCEGGTLTKWTLRTESDLASILFSAVTG